MTSPDRLPERVDAGENLIVRRWELGDVPTMRELVESSLDHLRPWMAWAAREPIADDARRRLIGRWDQYWESGQGCVYGIFERDRAVGGASLHRRVGPRALDLGYWLGRDATGRGIATQVADAMISAALSMDDIGMVEISHTADNAASGAIPERLGFSRIDDSAGIVRWQRRSAP